MKASTRQMVRRPGAVWRYMTDRKAPVLPKLALLFAAVYVVWPFDLIPDMAPILTWLDDFGVFALAMGWVSKAVLSYDRDREEDPALEATTPR